MNVTGSELSQPDNQLKELQQQLKECMSADEHRLKMGLNKLRKLQKSNKPFDKLQAKLASQFNASREKRKKREAAVPALDFPDQLPIVAKQNEILEAISNHQVVVIAGETGSGKTTQLPKLCLKAGRGVRGLIGHTQPRRLAARSVATRIAEELKVPLGQQVGYQVRFTDKVTDRTLIKLMTDGILLAETQSDPYFSKYDTIIIDEAHERSLNIDFLLGYLKRLLPKRPDLKVIITSATIDLERFSKHFDDAPVIEVSGRTFPVEVLYRPIADIESDKDDPVALGIVSAVEELIQLERQRKQNALGDILVFLSGEKDIRTIAKVLRDQNFPHTEITPLYARLSAAEQNRVFQSHAGRRIVLATNVAETSLTVPGIRYVIDPGMARISRYSYRSKVQSLPIEAVSQASANQRKGRCGRVAEGVCIRLYSEDDFLSREEFTAPEILRTNLASVILQMSALKLGEIDRFPFLEPPDSRFVKDGVRLLQELGAIDQRGALTESGRRLGRLPVDPKVGRMLLAAEKENCLTEVLIIASLLGIQDPRERPHEKQQASDEKHRRFYDKESDFITLVNFWNYWEEQRQELSQNQLRKLAKKEFIAYMRMREWREVHHQLRVACKEIGIGENEKPAGYTSIHKALLTGLLGNLGLKTDDREYLGARNKRLAIFPGSGQYKKKPKWMMAAELVETSKIYARTVAKIEPEWVEQVAGQLLKRTYNEPHWEKKQAQVMAYEQVSLFGLITTAKRRVHYGKIDAKLSREIFIRSALVEGDYQSKAASIKNNRDLIAEVTELESKARTRDILVDDEFLFGFYNERIPEHIVNGAGFESWYKKQNQKDLLALTKESLMRRDAGEVSEGQFPETLELDGMSFSLSYHFEPGHELDGVTITVPVVVLNQIPEQRLQWLVPGMIREKTIALIKALPKQIRKNFVPVPDYVDALLSRITFNKGSLTEAIAENLAQMTGVAIDRDDWRYEQLDEHYFFNISVVDKDGKQLASGRDLSVLRERFVDYDDGVVDITQSEKALEQQGLNSWSFGQLPSSLEVDHAGIKVKRFPAIVDDGDSVSIKLVNQQDLSQGLSQKGVIRLLRLQLSTELKYFSKQLRYFQQTSLLFATSLNKNVLLEDMLDAIVAHACDLESCELPNDEDSFQKLLYRCKENLELSAKELDELVYSIATQQAEVRKPLKGRISLEWATAYNDIKSQLESLLFPGFLSDTPKTWLVQYPRYLKAIALRLEKLGSQLNRDRQYCIELSGYWERYQTAKASLDEQGLPEPEGLVEYRWMLEEYRISLFAQTVGTLFSISAKRLNKQWEKVQGKLS